MTSWGAGVWLLMVVALGGSFLLAKIVARSAAASGSPAGRILQSLRGAWPRPAATALRCRASVRLTTQHSVHVVEFESAKYVVACHPGGVTQLLEATALRGAAVPKEEFRVHHLGASA